MSSLLIVHPVAAFFNLVCLALAGAAHLHSPSHSARYLLGLLILLLPTLLVTLLAFLVDILLFVPHLQWGGWIVLASTILITASGVVTCAMRRTLVSRKARKKRIAENAEMSGENFYNRQAQETKIPGQSFAMEPTVPMVNGAPGADRLPTSPPLTRPKSSTTIASHSAHKPFPMTLLLFLREMVPPTDFMVLLPDLEVDLEAGRLTTVRGTNLAIPPLLPSPSVPGPPFKDEDPVTSELPKPLS